MHTFLIMKKKLGSELLPTSHLIRVLWQSCQQCSTGRQELQRALARRTVSSLWMFAGQPWKDLKEILLYCIWSFIFSGRKCWISCFPSIFPGCKQTGCEWGAAGGGGGRGHGEPRTPGASPPQQVWGWYPQQCWSTLPAPAQSFQLEHTHLGALGTSR